MTNRCAECGTYGPGETLTNQAGVDPKGARRTVRRFVCSSCITAQESAAEYARKLVRADHDAAMELIRQAIQSQEN